MAETDDFADHVRWLRDAGYLDVARAERFRRIVATTLAEQGVKTHDELSGEALYELRFRQGEIWAAAKDFYTGIAGLVDDIEAGISPEAVQESGLGIARNLTPEVQAYILETATAIRKAEEDRSRDPE